MKRRRDMAWCGGTRLPRETLRNSQRCHALTATLLTSLPGPGVLQEALNRQNKYGSGVAPRTVPTAPNLGYLCWEEFTWRAWPSQLASQKLLKKLPTCALSSRKDLCLFSNVQEGGPPNASCFQTLRIASQASSARPIRGHSKMIRK